MKNCSTKTDTSRRAMVNTACSIRDLWPEASTFSMRARFLGFPRAFSKIAWASPAVVEMRAALAQTSSLPALRLMILACSSRSMSIPL